MNYWQKKATPWVTLAVLAGGLFSAGLLFWLTKVEADIQLVSGISGI